MGEFFIDNITALDDERFFVSSSDGVGITVFQSKGRWEAPDGAKHMTGSSRVRRPWTGGKSTNKRKRYRADGHGVGKVYTNPNIYDVSNYGSGD